MTENEKINLVGTCLAMCSEKERRMREKEGLLHDFEIDAATKKNAQKKKADLTKIVKSFQRPAAGKEMLDLSELRPAPVLNVTINYLFTKIATESNCDWVKVYDFIFDRLRAIRQDMTVQRINPLASICFLERIVRFHVYSSQRLCERKIEQYDPVINMQHLLKCITLLLSLYDEYESGSCDDLNVSENTKQLLYEYNRAETEALYILLRVGETCGLERGLSLNSVLRQDKEVKLAMEISFSWYLGNYVRACRLTEKLSPILKCGFFCNLQSIRRKVWKIMSCSYNSNNLTFPGFKLQKLLLYKSLNNVQKDCQLFGQKLCNENIRFQKSEFQSDVKMATPEVIFTESDLHQLLPNILLE